MNAPFDRVGYPSQGVLSAATIHGRKMVSIIKMTLDRKRFCSYVGRMTQTQENSKEPRSHITLTGEASTQLEKNKAAIEKRLGIKVTLAFVIKLALQSQAAVEQVD